MYNNTVDIFETIHEWWRKMELDESQAPFFEKYNDTVDKLMPRPGIVSKDMLICR